MDFIPHITEWGSISFARYPPPPPPKTELLSLSNLGLVSVVDLPFFIQLGEAE